MITSYNTKYFDTEKIKWQRGERIERIISLQKFISLFHICFTSAFLKHIYHNNYITTSEG